MNHIETICNSVIGASHVKKGTAKEDFGIVVEKDDCIAFVLGDGHGDPNCFRSNIGSKFICEVAANSMLLFRKNLIDNNSEQEILLTNSDRFIKSLIYDIFCQWTDCVHDHLKNNPFSNEEKDFINKQAAMGNQTVAAYLNGEYQEHIYGTTLIAGLLCKNYLLLLQQGDGKCSVLYENGKYEEPIPWDDRCFLNFTTSVSDSDGAESCRFSVIDLQKKPVIACFISSDGLVDSFAEDSNTLHSYYDNLIDFAKKNGADSLHTMLEKTLLKMSEEKSQDDITICGFYIPDIINSKQKEFSILFEQRRKTNELILCLNEKQRAIESVEKGPKLKALKSNLDLSKSDYEDKKAKSEMFASEVSKVRKDLEKIEKNHLDDNFWERLKNFLSSSYSSKAFCELKSNLKELREMESQTNIELCKAKDLYEKSKSEYDSYFERYERLKDEYDSLVKAIKQLNQENI